MHWTTREAGVLAERLHRDWLEKQFRLMRLYIPLEWRLKRPYPDPPVED